MENKEISDMVDEAEELSGKLPVEEDNYFRKLLDGLPETMDRYFYMGFMLGVSTNKDLEKLKNNNSEMYNWLMERKESGKNAYHGSNDEDFALFVEYQD